MIRYYYFPLTLFTLTKSTKVNIGNLMNNKKKTKKKGKETKFKRENVKRLCWFASSENFLSKYINSRISLKQDDFFLFSIIIEKNKLLV